MMKIVAVLLLSLAAVPALAQHHGHHGHWHRVHSGNWHWAPFIVGAATGAVIYDIYNRPVVVQQPPVIVQQPTITVQPVNCSPWTETQHPDGSITRTRTCAQ